jgi:hypothetical protein
MYGELESSYENNSLRMVRLMSKQEGAAYISFFLTLIICHHQVGLNAL